MLPVPPLPPIGLAGDWCIEASSRSRHAQDLRLQGKGGSAEILFERCAVGRLRDAYPVGLHDVEVQVRACTEDMLPSLLVALTAALGHADPRCPRLVLSRPAADRAFIAEAESAGFRHVVDVDLGSDECSLLAWEPSWASPADADLDRVPGT
ncbi:hypothetical protein AB0O07_06430 [Streptomyces sp. NPDC093085]|uniref:hypothetical protein n=1 Tax=Streptomyces sp. NPDC093085 TaxID=3155068 RepID=UPI0034484992